MSFASKDARQGVSIVLPRFILTAFLLGHAAIHLGYVSPRPPAAAGGPPWPFKLDSSWVSTALGLDVQLMRVAGGGLVAATLGGFVLAALAAIGVLPAGVWAGATAFGAIASICLLLLFFHPWLLVGVAIDICLLWAIVAAHWLPDWLAT